MFMFNYLVDHSADIPAWGLGLLLGASVVGLAVIIYIIIKG